MPAKVLPSEARPRRRERWAGGERGCASSRAAAVCAQANVRLYNSCRAHLVLLVELESKIKRLEYEKGVLLARRQGTALPPLPAQASGAGKRAAQRRGGAVGEALTSRPSVVRVLS